MNINRHLRILHVAKAVAQLSRAVPKKQTGAVITQKGLILAVGLNKPTAKKQLATQKKDGYCSLHAEISACQKVKTPSKLIGSTIYVFRKSNLNASLFAKPCANCQKYLKKVGVSTMVFTVNNKDSITFNIEKL